MDKREKIVFYVLASIQATLIFTISLIFVPLPQIALEMNLHQGDLLLITAAYGLPYSGLLLFGGRLTDKFEAKNVFMTGLGIFTLASVMAAFASTYEMLVTMRFIQGIGGSCIAPSAVGILRAVFVDEYKFNKSMAEWGTVSVLGAAMGPVIGGLVVSVVSWRWLFIIPILISILGILFTRLRLGGLSTLNPRQNLLQLDLAGAFLATLGISFASYGLISANEFSWSSMQVIVPLLIGTVLLTAFFFVEHKTETPLLPPAFLRNKVRVIGLVSILLAAAGSGLSMFFLSLFLQQIKRWTPLETAGAYVPFAAGLLLMSRFSVRLIQRWGTLTITLAGFLIGGFAFACLAAINYDSRFGWNLLPGYILLAIGMSLIFAGSAVLSTIDVKPSQIGLAGGVMNTSMELGPTVGLAIFMSVASLKADVVSGYAFSFLSAGIVYAVMFLLIIFRLRKTYNNN
jgi:MFS family permease